MPTKTFYNLKPEKKEKVEAAVKKEFARAPIAELSVKNIVSDSKIARGSFYQYFESKEDLVNYIIGKEFEKKLVKIRKILDNNDRNLFDSIPEVFDMAVENRINNIDYYRNIASYLYDEHTKFLDRISADSVIAAIELDGCKESEVGIVLKTLIVLLYDAITSTVYQGISAEEARSTLISQINIIRKGVSKE